MSKELSKELFGWLRFFGMIALVIIGLIGTTWSGAHVKPWIILSINTPASILLAISFWFSFVIAALAAISVCRRLDKAYQILGILCLVLSLALTGLIFFATTALAGALIVVLTVLADSAMGFGAVTLAYRDNIMKASSG